MPPGFRPHCPPMSNAFIRLRLNTATLPGQCCTHVKFRFLTKRNRPFAGATASPGSYLQAPRGTSQQRDQYIYPAGKGKKSAKNKLPGISIMDQSRRAPCLLSGRQYRKLNLLHRTSANLVATEASKSSPEHLSPASVATLRQECRDCPDAPSTLRRPSEHLPETLASALRYPAESL